MDLIIQNSFCKLEGNIPQDAEDLIREVLTYENDNQAEIGQLFYQLKLAQNYNNRKQFYLIKSKIDHLERNKYVCLYKDRKFPTGLLNIVRESLKETNTDYKVIDLRQAPSQSVILRWHNTPHTPRYYQKEMIDLGIQAGRGVFEAAVGSGKSLVMAYLIQKFSVNTLIIVPSVGLSGQIYNDFSSWFGKQNVDLLDAKKIRKQEYPKPISIVTVQSLASLQKSGEFTDFIRNIDMVCCDELHHAGASTYTNLLKDMDHIYYRFGFTGTFLRNDNKTLEMWSFLSNVIYQYPAWKAIEEKFLTQPEVEMYNLSSKPNRKYQKEYDSSYCGNPELLEKITQIVQNTKLNEQILILVNKKDKCGKLIHEYLNAHDIDNSYISGDNSKDEILTSIDMFNEKRIQVLIGSSVLGEGIDIRSTDHLIMCQGGKSEIVMVQAIGRGIRLFEGKHIAKIHDFIFNGTNYLYKHALERLDIYERNFRCKVTYN